MDRSVPVWDALPVVRRIALVALLASAVVAGVGQNAQARIRPWQPIYAPYFETWTTDTLPAVARASGSGTFTLAFLETLGRHSCTLAWDGDRHATVGSHRYVRQVAELRRMGGDVIPSFGGWSADQAGTEIADSCQRVPDIVRAYKQVIRTYDVVRLDMDVEGRSLRRSDGIDRRSEALHRLQMWGDAHGRTIQVQLTIPTTPEGLDAKSLAVVQSAVDHHVRIAAVNPMVFDFWDGTTRMAGAAIGALRGLHRQLAVLLPGKTDEQLWAMEGATMMVGIDDFPKKTEVTRLAGARRVKRFAVAKGMRLLSIWAIQRDNGDCPGTVGANECSGIAQPAWAFSHLLEPFAG